MTDSQKRCMFCGGGAPWGKEHVLPEWTATLLEVARLNVRRDHFSEPTRSWQKVGSFDLKADDVCEACNSGWLSDLETVATPILGPMIVAHGPSTLSEDAQVVLASWLWKIAVLHASGNRLAYFTSQERECLRLGDAPPANGVRIWLAVYKGTRVAKLQGGPATFKSPAGEEYSGMHITLRLGSFAAQVLAVRPIAGPRGVPVARFDFSGAEIQLWPDRGGVVAWPPGRALNDDTFPIWHDRWNAKLTSP